MSLLTDFLATFELWGLKIRWLFIIVGFLLMSALVLRYIFKIRSRLDNPDFISNTTNDGLNVEDISSDFREGLSPGAIAAALSLIYRWSYTKEWDRMVPSITEFGDGDFLYNVNDTYIKLHRKHKKFGVDILEFGVAYLKNCYCFFDYSRLKAVFEWYDTRPDDLDTSTAPPVPTYHALPSDRYCYGTARQEWED